MNRLKKKCVIATVGIHLLLLTILIVGPAFFNPRPKPDDTQVLDVIPANLIDAAFNSGVKNAVPPAPAPIISRPPPQPQPQPQRHETPPPPPEPKPEPSIVKTVERISTPKPVKHKTEKAEPVKKTAPKKPAETRAHKIEVNTRVVTRTTPKNSDSRRDSAAISEAIKNLRNNFKSGTEINLSGNSSVAYANYASIVRSVYDRAWRLPNTIARDENITVKVTIARDGSVASARIVTPSGDAPADASVQKTLDRVKVVAAFPDGSTDRERTFTIVFNPQVKNAE